MIENTSGFVPCGRAVLTEPYDPELKSASGIVIPQSVQDGEDMRSVKVKIVAVGRTAWSDEPEPRAEVGDIVFVSRMSGFMCQGADGRKYRFVNDRDVFARITKEAQHG